ncbi:Non-histone chromosomal protein 6 [Dimargaris verticillata]|uniref:Non-histone chromosomal protein 6 n=1 Tax=Dimargaris verticillata TaxID=2761393 RepID=A0A9W8B1U1_9FUNG|nr:Non-histone chromosomal protein 6 [Dimargaris verticillata]
MSKAAKIEKPALFSRIPAKDAKALETHFKNLAKEYGAISVIFATIAGTQDEAAAPAKPPARPKPVRDPNAPKKALSPYILFCNDERPAIKTQNPDSTSQDVSKLLGEKWQKLDPLRKKFYEELHAQDRQRFLEENAMYQATLLHDEGMAPPATAASVLESAARSTLSGNKKRSHPEASVAESDSGSSVAYDIDLGVGELVTPVKPKSKSKSKSKSSRSGSKIDSPRYPETPQSKVEVANFLNGHSDYSEKSKSKKKKKK